jgi:hypothetical protein
MGTNAVIKQIRTNPIRTKEVSKPKCLASPEHTPAIILSFDRVNLGAMQFFSTPS